MTLTAAQKAAREGKLTGSVIGCLMTGDESKIMALWRSMIGDPEYVPDDLSDVWPVQLGSTTEQLNLDWYERRTGRAVTKRGLVVTSPLHSWAAATLDGWVDALQCPIEVKHVGGFEPRETVTARYMPQMHWQMMVTGATQCVFSVIEGAREPNPDLIGVDDRYAAELFRRAERFMECVRTLTPPIAERPAQAAIVPTVVYDMTGKNEWANHAADWVEHRDGKQKFDKAEKGLKTLVPADAQRAHGHGVEIKRDKAGRLSVRPLEAA